ncbi:M56 family metallopeptidase [Glycomyces sp. MUSA5-2]|uniref:M56 family metallopeptidase n=1 Tax=Glycomyces sp. MUSA5-2 TaxID=2053002 RepID=UPI0030086E3F
MIAAGLLLSYAAVLGWFGPRVLERARWVSSLPRLAIASWFALAGSWLLAVVLAGAVLVVPLEVHDGGPRGLAWHCLTELREHYGTFGAIALGAIAVVLVFGVPARALGTLAAVAREAGRERDRLRRMLSGCPVERASGASVVDDARVAAFCLPGRGGLIALTSGAVALLDRAQLRAVVAHERAHLAGRHHLIALVAEAAGRAFRAVPLFAKLPDHVAHLVEMAADDTAARAAGRRTLAASLLHVAAAQVPPRAMAASGGDTVARIERLLGERSGPGPAGVGTILGGNLAALAAPLLIMAAPVAAAVGIACC